MIPFTPENEARVIAGVRELRGNRCLICERDKNCFFPFHSEVTRQNNLCPFFQPPPFSEQATLLFKRWLPEEDWDEILKDADWDARYLQFVADITYLKIQGVHRG